MLKRILQLIVVLLIATQGVMAQTVQIETVTKPPGDITVGVNMTGFTDVAAITLKIKYDPELFSFDGISNTAIAGNWVPNATGGYINISYTSSAIGTGYPLNGKAFDLNLHYKGGFSGDLQFETGDCEIAASDLSTYTVTYTDGSVSQTSAVGHIFLTDADAQIGSVVSLPVKIEPVTAGLSDVSSITLVLDYSDCALDFNGIQAGAIDGVTYNDNYGTLELTWSSETPVDLSSASTLFTLDFNYFGSDVDLSFAPGCEVVTADLSTVAMNYTDCTVTPSPGTMDVEVAQEAYSNIIIYQDPLGTDNIVTIGLPVNVSNFGSSNVGAITLNMSYDASLLTYKGYTAEQLSGWTVNNSDGELTFEWSSMTGSALADGKLLTLKFDYDTTTSDASVGFKCGSIIKDTELKGALPVNFIDGGVTQAAPPTTFMVSGQLTYNGDASKPIGTSGSSTTTVYLKNPADSSVVYTTGTDANGNFEFTDVAPGSYFLDASTTIDATMAYDLTDAYLIFGTGSTFTGLIKKAADVNEDNMVDQADAFIVFGSYNNGYVKVPAWIAPDWVFNNIGVTVTNSDVVQNFEGLATGDVDAIWVPVP